MKMAENGGIPVRFRYVRRVIASLALSACGAGTTVAQDTVKVGLVLSMTGQQASTGRQIKAAVNLYMKEHGDTVAGRTIQIILRDSASIPDNTSRLAQELIAKDKVDVLAGFEITPAALVVAPLATKSRIVELVMAAGTSIITERSPYIVRTSFTVPQSCVVIADWAAKNKIEKVVTIVSDYAPGFDAEQSFTERFKGAGGIVAEAMRAPLANPDFGPLLDRAAAAKPDAVFIFVPAGQGGMFMKQFAERGLDKAGIRVIGPGDVTDDDLLAQMGDAAIGTVTAHFYSTDHKSAKNENYVASFEEANHFRPNFMSVGGYDGMHLIFEALKKTGGKADGDTLIAAMRGMEWESPRGPISIDPDTRDIIQNIYVRKVEKKGGQLYNVEFATFKAVEDPVKAAKKKIN
jgi:branched-chain amino acid transport system substrate-binding protein